MSAFVGNKGRDFTSTVTRGKWNVHFQSNTIQQSLRVVSHWILSSPRNITERNDLFLFLLLCVLPIFFHQPLWPSTQKVLSAFCLHWKLGILSWGKLFWFNSATAKVLNPNITEAAETYLSERTNQRVGTSTYFDGSLKLHHTKKTCNSNPHFCKTPLGSWRINNRNSSHGWFHPWWGNWTKDSDIYLLPYLTHISLNCKQQAITF